MVLSSLSALFIQLVITEYQASFPFLEYLKNGGLLDSMPLCLKIVSSCFIVVLYFICQGILCSLSPIRTQLRLLKVFFKILFYSFLLYLFHLIYLILFHFVLFHFILIALGNLLFCFITLAFLILLDFGFQPLIYF